MGVPAYLVIDGYPVSSTAMRPDSECCQVEFMLVQCVCALEEALACPRLCAALARVLVPGQEQAGLGLGLGSANLDGGLVAMSNILVDFHAAISGQQRQCIPGSKEACGDCRNTDAGRDSQTPGADARSQPDRANKQRPAQARTGAELKPSINALWHAGEKQHGTRTGRIVPSQLRSARGQLDRQRDREIHRTWAGRDDQITLDAGI